MSAKYEIYLDESGDFEKPEDNRNFVNVSLIGGILVPEALKAKEKDLRNELIDIGKLYFPNMRKVTDIHIGELKDNFQAQAELRGKLSKFFLDKLQDTKIVFIYSRKALEEKSLYGPQFYRNMLLNLIKTIVIYSPFFEVDASFDIRLAHRRVGYISALRDDLLSRGYRKLKDKKGKLEVTAITTADIETIMKLLKDSLNFTCSRSDSYSMKPYDKWDNPFMTMADWICNTIYNLVKNNADIGKLHTEISQMFGGRILFYAEDDYDFPFNLLSRYFQNTPDKFLAEYLTMSAGRESRYRFSDSYLIQPALIKVVMEQMMRVDDPDVLANIIALADDFLVNKDFYKLSDVLGLIKSVHGKLYQIADGKADIKWDPVAYRFHDVCLRYYNHNADTVNAVIHRDKGEKIFHRLSSSAEITTQRRYHEFINRYSVCDTNDFAFQRAIDTLRPIQDREEKLLGVFPHATNEILGKIYGSVAQNYAFMQDNTNTAAYFEKAKVNLGTNNFVQASYRAYFSVDTKNQKDYERELAFLFKRVSFPGYVGLFDECMQDLVKNAFSFHLLLKGLLIFPPNSQEMMAIRDKILRTNLNVYNIHPWQMIFMVVGRLMAQWRMKDNARLFWEKAANFTNDKNQHTFWMLGDAARAWQAIFEIQEGKIPVAVNLLNHIKNTFFFF